MKKATILIADDHSLVREGLARVLEIAGFERLIHASDGQQAVDLAKQKNPDIVLLDINMPGLDGIAVCRVLTEELPSVKTIMLTMHAEDEFLFEAIKAGAIGYVLKNHAAAELVEVIEKALEGQPQLDPQLAARIMKEFSRGPQPEPEKAQSLQKLTARETDVLKLVAKGMSNKEIAGTLFISEMTAKNHLKKIFEKLQVNDRTKAAVIALRHKLV